MYFEMFDESIDHDRLRELWGDMPYPGQFTLEIHTMAEYRVMVHFPDGDSIFTMKQKTLADTKAVVERFIQEVQGSHDGAPYEVWKGEELVHGEVSITEADRLIVSALED